MLCTRCFAVDGLGTDCGSMVVDEWLLNGCAMVVELLCNGCVLVVEEWLCNCCGKNGSVRVVV